MIIKTRKEALAAFKDPLRLVSTQRKNYLFRLYYLIAVAVLLFGIAGLVSGMVRDNRANRRMGPPFGKRNGGDLLMPVVTMYGAYRLFTVKKSVTRHLKRQLTNKQPPIDLG